MSITEHTGSREYNKTTRGRREKRPTNNGGQGNEKGINKNGSNKEDQTPDDQPAESNRNLQLPDLLR